MLRQLGVVLFQTCIKRIRLNMPVMDDEFTSAYQNDSDDDNDAPVNANADQPTNQVNNAL